MQMDWLTWRLRNMSKSANVGEQNPRAKLKIPDVVMIRIMASKGANLHEIAHAKGMNPSSINHVVNRRTWKHVQ